MTSWIVRRWARYGHERLYAETPGGTALGYLDLTTGRFHSDDLSNLPLLKAAINEHLASQGAGGRPGASDAEPMASGAQPSDRSGESCMPSEWGSGTPTSTTCSSARRVCSR